MSRLALVVGNAQYKHKEFRTLEAVYVDIKAMQDVLEDDKIGKFDRVDIFEDIDYRIFSNKIENFFKDGTQEDLLLVYFSGHGYKEDNEPLYLTCTDTDPDHLRFSALRASDIRDIMDRSDASQQIIILDCCYSGAFFSKSGELPNAEKDIKMLGERRRSKIVLAASSEKQKAYESTHRNSPIATMPKIKEGSIFTHFLVEGLKNGIPGNANGEIHVNSLFKYAESKVNEYVKDHNLRQWPIQFGGFESPNMIIGYTPENTLLRRVLKNLNDNDLAEISNITAQLRSTNWDEIADKRPAIKNYNRSVR